MLKNEFKTIALISMLIICLTSTFVFAENEVVGSDTIQPRTTTDSNVNENEIAGSETIQPREGEDLTNTVSNEPLNSDAYLYGDDLIIDYPIDGNLFAVGKNITINSQIGGDAFICANNITIGEDAYIYSNLFALGDSIEIKGVIYDVYACASNLNISGYVYRNVLSACKNFTLGGLIGRNVKLSTNTINFTEVAKIYGNLDYTSSEEITISDGVIAGNVNFNEKLTTPIDTKNEIKTHIINLGTSISTISVIWLLLLWLLPSYQEKISSILAKKTLPSFGIGLLTPILAFIAFIMLLVIEITSSLALLLLTFLLVSFGISIAIFVIAISELICKKLKIEIKYQKFGIVVASSIILWLLRLIPVLGGIISFISTILGLGIIVKSLLPTNKENIAETKVIEENK